MYTFLDEFIFNIYQRGYQIDNYNKSINYIEIINTEFGLASSFCGLFEKPSIRYHKFKENLQTKIKELNRAVTIKECDFEDFDICVPELYVEKLILDELKKNIKNYSRENTPINIEYDGIRDGNLKKIGVSLIITNEINSDRVEEFSSNEGLNSLKQLSDSDLFKLKYHYNVDAKNNTFIQNFKFMI
jgi:hypothetical protein